MVGMLAPLGVYSFKDGTYSMGEIRAMGDQLDMAAQWMKGIEQDSSLITASDDALREYARVFAYAMTQRQGDELRLPVIALLNIGGDGFTLAAINAAIAQCGINALAAEKGGGIVEISFPGQTGVPEGFEFIKKVIEDILPAHLETEYIFTYLTWGQAGELTWLQAAQYTWDELRQKSS